LFPGSHWNAGFAQIAAIGSRLGGLWCDALGRQSEVTLLIGAARRWIGSMDAKGSAHGGRSMSFYQGMTCENVTINGAKGTPITAYVAKPSGSSSNPGVVLIHHLPGWSEFYIETTRRFAHHGYLAICANLYEREGGGSDGNPDDVAAKVRAEGGIADSQMVGDTEGAVKWIRAQPSHNGKVGLFGSCSGGRHAFIYACQRKDVDACAELWGGRVVMGKEELNPKTPAAPIDMTRDLCCPLLGLFGNEDRAPSPEQVNQHEAELKKHGKTYEFQRYDGAGHGFLYWHRPLYRPEQAMDGWSRVFAFSLSIWRSRKFGYVHLHH
jgi:carboxymethylenebutenolidase